jgi:hypothetical protein
MNALEMKRSERDLARSIERVRVAAAHLSHTLPFASEFTDALTNALDLIADKVEASSTTQVPPMRPREAATYVGMSRATFDGLVGKGELKAAGENGLPSARGHRRQLLFEVSELNRFLGRA